MKRITISLTDEEYADLEQRAQQERRTPREMAAYLVTHPQGWTYTPDWTYRPFPNTLPYLTPPYIIRTTDNTGVPTSHPTTVEACHA